MICLYLFCIKQKESYFGYRFWLNKSMATHEMFFFVCFF